MNGLDVPARVLTKRGDGPFVAMTYWIKNSRAQIICILLRKMGTAEKDIKIEADRTKKVEVWD